MSKISPIKEDGSIWGSGVDYKRIIWLMCKEKSTIHTLVQQFAVGCRFCNQWWGWTLSLRKAKRIEYKMSRVGCPRCKRRLSDKRYAKLLKRREKYEK